MARNVLMIAYHFPPQSGSSGLLRSLKFARYLPENGWRPTVLTVDPRAYERLDETRLQDVPREVEVVRAFARDSKRHFSIGSYYPLWTALPDRWVSWCGEAYSGTTAVAISRGCDPPAASGAQSGREGLSSSSVTVTT